jgi:CHASE1-domain containing sensor protein
MPQERERIIASLRRQGISNFRIWPAQERAEYHAVIYFEPLDQRNQLVIGYDMFTDPTRREAMERARDQGIDAASGKVRLMQETEEPGQASFIIYVPVYRGGIPQAVADRRAALQGFVYSLFRVGDLLAGFLDTHHPLPLGLEVYDGTELKPEGLLYRSSWLRPGDASRAQFQKRSKIDVAGRPWTRLYGTQSPFGFQKCSCQ